MQSLQIENNELLKQLASKAKRSDADQHDSLRRECSSLAAALATLESTHASLREELDTVRREEMQKSLEAQEQLNETRRLSEDKMRRYEDDLGSLLASWQQQQKQLDVWVHTITAQQQYVMFLHLRLIYRPS